MIEIRALLVEREDCDAGTVQQLRNALAQGGNQYRSLREAGLCPAPWLQPEKTTPRDLFTDKVDISCGWHAVETWSPCGAPPPPGPPCGPD